MTKKDYILIADVIKELKETATPEYDMYGDKPEDNVEVVSIDEVIDSITAMLEKENPRFKRDTFINYINK